MTNLKLFRYRNDPCGSPHHTHPPGSAVVIAPDRGSAVILLESYLERVGYTEYSVSDLNDPDCWEEVEPSFPGVLLWESDGVSVSA